MTLGELFAGIANAIRSKDGTTDRIPALTFPERIMALSGGGGGGSSQFAETSFVFESDMVFASSTNLLSATTSCVEVTE